MSGRGRGGFSRGGGRGGFGRYDWCSVFSMQAGDNSYLMRISSSFLLLSFKYSEVEVAEEVASVVAEEVAVVAAVVAAEALAVVVEVRREFIWFCTCSLAALFLTC